MPSKRLSRLNEQLKREIAGLLRTRVRDPRVELVTVTGVNVSRDLSVARVFVRLGGEPAERADSMKGLDAAAPFLRGTLGKLLHVRRIPELRFEEDRSIEHARRIDEILAQVDIPEAEDDPDGPGEEGGREA